MTSMLKNLIPKLAVVLLGAAHLAHAQTGACIQTTNQLVVAEATVPSTANERVYIMCPYLNYSISTLNYYNELEDNGMAMIPLRPNMHLRCGYSGRRDGNCIVTGGDLFVDGTSYYDVLDDSVDGVVIEGFTFVGAGKFVAEFTKPGKVTFRDCIFKDAVNATAAVFADYFNMDQSNSLELTFQRCDFIGNNYFWNGGQAALVIGNSLQNRLIFDECRFEDNDMVKNNTRFETNSYLIESAGPLEMINNCFSNNSVGVAAASAYNSLFSVGNFGLATMGGKCPLAAKFSSALRYEMFAPECTQYEASVCSISSTFAPIGSPTIAPSDFPTYVPTTASPTSSTKAPTSAPSAMPTTTLSNSPTLTESSAPTVDPTAVAPIDFSGSSQSSSQICMSFVATSTTILFAFTVAICTTLLIPM